jgi:hypothetical protein
MPKDRILDPNEKYGLRVWPKSGEAKPNDDYFTDDRIVEKWCCCRKK